MSGVHSVLLSLKTRGARPSTSTGVCFDRYRDTWGQLTRQSTLSGNLTMTTLKAQQIIARKRDVTNETCLSPFDNWKFSWQQQGFCNSFPGLGTERLPGTESWRREIEEALQSKESGHSHDNVGGLLGVVRLLGGRVRQAGEVVLIWWNLT